MAGRVQQDEYVLNQTYRIYPNFFFYLNAHDMLFTKFYYLHTQIICDTDANQKSL